jgi:hypothetical protein
VWWQGRWGRKEPAVFVVSGIVLHKYDEGYPESKDTKAIKNFKTIY